jgi:hypothetical protein
MITFNQQLDHPWFLLYCSKIACYQRILSHGFLDRLILLFFSSLDIDNKAGFQHLVCKYFLVCFLLKLEVFANTFQILIIIHIINQIDLYLLHTKFYLHQLQSLLYLFYLETKYLWLRN